jgi:hypothetical protein
MNARHLIQHNFWWKLISVMLAAVVWWRIHPLTQETKKRPGAAEAELTTTREFTLPVRVLTSARNPRGYAVTPGEVTVTVSGPSLAILALKPETIHVYVDVDAWQASGQDLAEIWVNPPDEVKWARTYPRQVLVAPR